MRKYTLKYTLSLALGITFVVFIFFLIEDFLNAIIFKSLLSQILLNLIFAIVVGVILSGGIFTFAPVLSDAMTTLRRMLRIESLSNPLLLKLSGEAPGTYHHSLNVSTLAHKAARAIGADSLLVRTAAYYHDLGKLSEPTRFVENQSGQEVPSDESIETINESAKIIISHVEIGVKMAEEANLPDEIIDLIREHHGTTRALYFYGKAKEKGLKIKKTDFRYTGPAPRTKESAILMLADCVEAAARATPNLTPIKIEEIVINTIAERIADKQFTKTNLSDADLNLIQQSLISTLNSIYHQRIEYK